MGNNQGNQSNQSVDSYEIPDSPTLSKNPPPYQIGKKLYDRSGRKVFEISLNNKKYALKELSYNDDEELNNIKKEYLILKKDLPYLVKAYGSKTDTVRKEFSFSMKFYSGGTLEEYIESKQTVPFNNFMKIFRNIVAGE